MKFLSSWSNWSVGQFVAQENWHGKTQKNDPKILTSSVAREKLPEQSWSLISVEKFLNLNNWDGKLKPRENFPIAAEVRGIIFGSSWSSLSVAAFLQAENWNGLYKPPSPAIIEQIEVTNQSNVSVAKPLGSNWSALRVGEFFEDCNWHGRTLQGSKDTLNPTQMNLNLSVGEFFGSVIWEGKPEIGTLPQFEPESDLIAFPASAKEATVDDLFDIF